jgi:hypothetical protein
VSEQLRLDAIEQYVLDGTVFFEDHLPKCGLIPIDHDGTMCFNQIEDRITCPEKSIEYLICKRRHASCFDTNHWQCRILIVRVREERDERLSETTMLNEIEQTISPIVPTSDRAIRFDTFYRRINQRQSSAFTSGVRIFQ